MSTAILFVSLQNNKRDVRPVRDSSYVEKPDSKELPGSRVVII